MAIRSSIFSGLKDCSTPLIPPDSNWNTPSVLPADIIFIVSLSFSGILLTENPGSWLATILQVSSMTVRLRSPKKSIFKSPSSSNAVMVYCVTAAPSFTLSGTYSSTGRSVITTPAACVDACLGIPSTLIAMSSSLFAVASVWHISLNSGVFSIACFRVMPSSRGISFAILSHAAYGISIALPTSLTAARAAIVPKVTI